MTVLQVADNTASKENWLLSVDIPGTGKDKTFELIVKGESIDPHGDKCILSYSWEARKHPANQRKQFAVQGRGGEGQLMELCSLFISKYKLGIKNRSTNWSDLANVLDCIHEKLVFIRKRNPCFAC